MTDCKGNERGSFLLAGKDVSIVEIAEIKIEQIQNTMTSKKCSESVSAFRYLRRTLKNHN